MSEGTTIPAIVDRLLELITARVGNAAKVLDQTPTQVVDMLAATGRPQVIYIGPSIGIGHSVVIMTASELRIEESFTLDVVCEVSAEAANISLGDARHLCAELAYAVLTTVARKPDLGLVDDTEHQYFDVIPRSGAYLHGAIGDSAIAVGVRHVITLTCNNRLILLKQ